MATQNNTSPSLNKEVVEAAGRQQLDQWIQLHKPCFEIFLDAYCVVDVNNCVADFNIAFTELCGESYRRIQKVADFCSLLRTEICPANCPAVQIVKSKAPLRVDEIMANSKGQTRIKMILSGIPIFANSGEIIGSLITIRNVSAESELQKKYDERKHESVTDGLTKLFNKVYSQASLTRQVKLSFDNQSPLSVLVGDVDHFKKVNDTYGHQAGDYVLTTVAELLSAQSRETDMVGRFGGEEFIIILPNTDSKGALGFAEKCRKAIEAHTFTHNGTVLKVNMSLGTSTLTHPTEITMEKCARELINRADTALYFAKAHGRNQCTQYEALKKTPTSDPGDSTKA